jgi:hypothetical protein
MLFVAPAGLPHLTCHCGGGMVCLMNSKKEQNEEEKIMYPDLGIIIPPANPMTTGAKKTLSSFGHKARLRHLPRARDRPRARCQASAW